MTETSFQYTLMQPLPVASPPTYLLLIDSRVSNYQDIINAKQPGVYHIIFDAPTRPTHSKKLIKDIEDKIAELGVAAFTGVGFVQHNDEKPFYEMFGRTSDVVKPRIRYVETVDPNIHSWNSITSFITILRQNYGIEYFDMMACALYSNPDWKYIIDRLGALTGVAVRASTDDTGAAVLGGDWFLESHTGLNLKSVYFTESIENYNGLLYTAPAPAPTSTTPPTKKLILIDNRIKEIDVIINSINDDTYCLVFNYFYDTPATILSKLRFLNSDNRYILDSFYYETPELPTRMDASGNQCTPCDDFDITDMQLFPETLQNEYLEYTTFSPDASGNGGVWPFYSESTKITISKPVFFQRAKIGETAEQVVYPSTDVSSVILNYKYRPMVLVSDLDEMYELGQNVGEIVGGATAFECVGIIQHTVDPYIGYKFIGGGDDSVSPAIIQDVVSRDASLSSWAAFTGVIQSLKTVHQTTTLDMMACALYANPDWKYIIDTLAVRENIKIRASLDNTGFAAAEDGEANWVLETDDVSLTTVYFTDKIYEWKYVLATYIDTRFNALRWNDSMYATRAYDSRLKIAAGTNPFTIETWYYETTTRFNCTIVDMGNYNYTFQIRNQNLTDPKGLSFYSNLLPNWLYAESAVVPIAQWSHLAITRSGSTFTFYVNGIVRQIFTSSVSFNSNNSTFVIGLQSPDNCACNKMKVDTVLYDIRLWNVARTATQIQMFRNRVVPANSTGLVANYLCTDNGSSLNDRTSNTLHTTIQNYDSTRWSNTTVPIPNIGFLINNSYSLRTSNTGTALNAFTHFNDITYTDFSGVDLSGVNFSGGDLTGCNFTNANLTNTDFTNAYLISATTTNATTTGSNIAQAITSYNIAQALTSYTPDVLILDGIDDAVDLGIPAWTYSTQLRQTITVECWFRTTDTNNQKGTAWFISRNNSAGFTTGSSFSLGMNTAGIIIFWIQGQNNSSTFGNLGSIGSYKDARWHHAAVTYQYNTGVINMYVDGVLDATSTAANVGILSYNTTTNLVIGSDHAQFTNGSIDRQFRGLLSDIRVWNVVRSASEIADNYRRRLVGNESGLVGYWKLNQGRGSGWSSYYAVLDSTSNIPYGTLTGQGAGNWTISNINFQPRISAITLGAKNGVYNFTDSSFSFIDPSSNSLGSFSYAVSPSSVATIANGAATTKTIYSLSAANLVPTYATFEFPEIASLSSWQIDISFTVTGGTSTWRALIGDMFNQINPSPSRGWGLWVSSSNRIHWTWVSNTAEPTSISVSLNTPYVLTAAQSSGTITLTLRTVSSGATQTGSFSVGANIMGKGPVTIGNWIGWGAEYFPGTISYVNVSVPTNQRVVTFSSGTDGTPATVSAIQDISLDFGSGSRTASLTVNKIAPTIGSLTVPAKNFGAVAFDLTAPTSNSDGAITYTSSVAGVATVTSGGTVSIVGAGSTTITATQASTTNYTGGSVTATLVVSPIAPTIGSLTAPAKNFGAVAFDLTAPTSNSDGAITYTSSVAGVATVTSGGTVSIVGAGSTTITATQASTTNYTGGSVTATLVVSPIAPTIGSLTAPAKNFGAVAFDLTAPTSNSGGAITYTSSVAGVATVTSGGTVTIVGAGSTTITATQASTTNYTGGSVTATLVVSPIAPTIQALSVSDKNFGDASFNLTAPSSNSGGVFTYSSSNTAVATVTTGGIVIIVGAGSTTITATQEASADGNYTTSSVTKLFTVSPIAPTIGTLSVSGKNFGDASFNLTAPSSNSNGAFSYTSSNEAAATVALVGGVGVVTVVGAGTTTITATQAASSNGNYTGGSSVSASLVVSAVAPNIDALSVPAKNFGDASFNLTAPISNSGGAFSYTSSNEAVATVALVGGVGMVTVVGVGSTTITATQAASSNGNYTGGSTVSASLVVSAVAPNIGALSVPAKNFGDASFNITAPTSNSGGAFSYTSSNEAVATVALVGGVGVVTVVGAGSTTITASQAASADGNYTGGTSVSASLVVSAIAPTYQAISQVEKTYSTDVSFSLTSVMSGVSNSSGAYTFSSTSDAISIDGGVATILAYTLSAITITATQAALGNYTASTKTFTLLVARKTPSYGAFTVPAATYEGTPFSIAAYAPTTDSASIPFTYTSSEPTVATINSDGTVMTIVGQGYTTITASQVAGGNYAAGSITTSFLVNRAAPTFLKAFTITDKTFGNAPFSLLPFTDGLDNTDGTYHFTSSNSDLVSISGIDGVTATIHAYTPTPITIYVAIDACGNYAASSTSGTLTVARAAPTIGALSVPAKNFGDASFNLTAPTSNSSGAFTYTSSNTAVASVSTVDGVGTVTVVGAGTATITATQAINGNYTGGSSVSASLVVSAIAPTIGALSVPAKNFGDASFNITAPTSNSSGAFTYTSSNNAVATVSSVGGVGTVTVVGAGTATITATQAASADGNYTGGSSVTASLVVSAIAPTIGALSVPAKNFGDASFNITAPTSNSSGAFTYTSSNNAVATVSSVGGVGSVTVVGAGTATITATQAASADGNYTGGSSVSASLVVSAIAPTIGALSVPAKNFGDASFNITAPTSNSSGAFTYTSSNTAVATVSSVGGVGTVTVVGAGTATITATQAASADGNYTGGSSVTASLVVSAIAPTIGALSVPAKNFGDASFNITAPTSNSSGAFTYTSSNTAVASVTIDGIVTIVAAGTTTITATQEAIVNGNFLTGSVSATLVVSAIAPTIQVLSVPAKNFGASAFDITAPTSNSGGAITYTSSVAGVATITSGGTVTIVGAGSTTITATQSASSDGNYTGGSSVTATLVVSAIAPTIGALSVPAKNFGASAFDITAPSSNSGGAITYTSSVAGVATVTSGGRVTVVGAGSTTITATQSASADGNYTGGSSVTATLVVSAIAPTIGALSVPAKNFGASAFDITAPTSNSGGAITYTSSVVGVATVTSGGTVTIVGAGSTTITATQAASADGNYTGGSSVTATLVVSAIAPTIGALSVPAKNFGASAFDITAPSSNSGGAITYTSSVAGVATVTSGGRVTVVGAGSTTITATQSASADGNYTGGSSVTATLVVSAIAPTIGALSVPAKNFGASAFDITAPSSNSGGAITYTSSVAGVATVTSGGTVTIVGAGSTTITATQSASGNYTGGSVTATLVVSAIAPTIGALSVPAKNFGDSAFDLAAPSSNSNGDFIYSSSAEGVATVTSGGRVTVVGAGSTTITASQAASADGNYTSGTSVSASLVVSAITPTYQAIAQVEKTYGTDVSFSLTSVVSGKSDSSGAYSFSSASNAISISGGVATILAYTPSAITITASQDASGNYTASTKTFTLLVARKTPSYGAFTVPAATYEGTPFSIAAYAPTTDSSGIPFTYTSSEPSVATISSDGTVMAIIGQGYTTITASQVAGGNYAAGSITTSFLVNRAAPTFLKAFTITDKTFGNAPFSLLPFTDGLDNTDGTYHFTSSNAQLVSISEVDGVTATIHAYTPTPITIYVAIDACGNYAASSTSGTLTVARAAPTIGALSVPAKNFGADAFDITAPSSNSNGNFIYSSSAPAVATVSTTGGVGTVSIVGVGSTTITATQDASGNYTGGSSVTATLVVSAIAPTIGALSVPAKNLGDASFNITAPSSNSGGAITYTSSSPAVATVSTTGGVGRVTIVGAGSTTITATQDASGNYTGGSVTATLVVSEPLSNFTVPADKKYGDAAFDLTDPTSIDDNVSFTFTSSNSAVASIGGAGGRTVTIVNAGSSIITATQAATANRDEANISATLVVARITPVITLAAIPKTYGSASFRLTPTSTNTDDISGTAFSFSSNNTSVASIVDTSFVRIDGVGEATITINQSTTTNFAVGTGSVVITVSKGTPVLSTFSVSANKTYGSAPFSALLSPTSASAGAITYSSSDASVATIDDSGLITLLAQGYVNFTARQAATALYNSATKTSNTMTVHRQAIVLTRASPSSEVVSKTYGNDNFTVSATNISSGAITYASDNPSVASVINASTGVISVGTVGTAIITASRAQTAQYTSEPVSWTVQVARITTTLSGLANLTRNVTVAPFAVAASSASDGAVSYALQDPSSTVLTIHPTTGVITLLSPGSAVIVASQAQGTLYEAPASITATITVTSVGNALQGATLTSTANFSNVNLNGGNLNNVNINNSNFTGVDLSGATLTSASITGATFTGASLVRADLTGATLISTVFTNVDLSGGILVDVDASGSSFANATLRNVNLTGANVTNVNFTNTNIKGANITDVSFSPLQKIQLLKNSDNRDINAIAISSVSGSTVLAAISESSPLRSIPNLDLTSVESVAVIIPQTATLSTTPISNVEIDVETYDKFYLPINEGEYFKINDVRYYSSSNVIRNYTTNEIVDIITYGGKPIWLFVGSIFGLVLLSNTLNTSSFVVPSDKSVSDQTPFMPTTLPTSNSSSPIVYSSSNTNIATINATTGEITITGNTTGIVTFTATQVQNATYEPGTITSNSLVVDQYIHFSLVGLNQSFNLTTLASLDAFNLIADNTDATAVFYVRLSDMTDVFKYQSDSADVNDISATDLKYYVFNRKWPAELKINPSHAMLNKADSAGMLGTTQLFAADKALVKHDFVRYLALKLFNTIHGVDLFKNETDLQENATYYGENIRNNINEILSGISTTSGDETMAYDASGNKYLTNSASGNTNICRELMRQIASSVASRFYNNGADDAGMKMVPLREDDTMTFKVIIQAAATQNILTGVSEIPSRSYTIKLVLKSSVTSETNANTVISDSEMFPNSYPYSSSVSSIAPDSEAAATVYNIYSPPAPIPFTRFGFNGWYYANSSAWVSVNSGVRNHVKWLVSSNSAGSSTVNALQYIRLNLKIHNKTALPYLMVYTQSGSWRKYVVSGGGGSLTNGTKYSFYTNFNSYSREPAMIGYTNVELVNTLGNGGFASNEVITNIALETDSGATAGTVEFTLASIIVGELASGVPSEKEYGFLAAVPSAYP